MKNYGSSIKHYPEREKRRRKWRWIIAFAAVCLVVLAAVLQISRHREEVRQREMALEKERILKDSLAQEEAFRKFCEREEQERLRREKEAEMEDKSGVHETQQEIPPTTTSPLARKALRDLERDPRYRYDDDDDSDYDESDEDDYDEDYDLYYGR